jgi:hypothetical protein
MFLKSTLGDFGFSSGTTSSTPPPPLTRDVFEKAADLVRSSRRIGWCMPSRDWLLTQRREYLFEVDEVKVEEVIPVEDDNVFAPRIPVEVTSERS